MQTGAPSISKRVIRALPVLFPRPETGLILVGKIKYPKTVDAWFDPTAFADPAPGTWGDLPNQRRGPGRDNWNLSIFKSFVFSESRGHGSSSAQRALTRGTTPQFRGDRQGAASATNLGASNFLRSQRSLIQGPSNSVETVGTKFTDCNASLALLGLTLHERGFFCPTRAWDKHGCASGSSGRVSKNISDFAMMNVAFEWAVLMLLLAGCAHAQTPPMRSP
jgi:hypothetical protein